MKNTFYKKLSLFLAVTLIFISFIAPLPAASASSGTPNPIAGRILTTDMSGDNANWVEIAQYGDYSLIVRTKYINWYPGAGYYGNYDWQYITYGANTSYTSSNVYKRLKEWFCGSASSYGDNLKSDARLRKFTMENNAKYAIGTSSTKASLTNGFSNPIPVQRPWGDDIAFALSYSESVAYISYMAFIRDMDPNNQNFYSNASAQANYMQLASQFPTSSTEKTRGMWLRSPGDLPNTAGALASVKLSNSLAGRAFQYWINTTYANEYGYIYPALWVNSGVFLKDTYPITVNYYKDSVASGNLLKSDSLPAAAPGTPIDNVDLTAYAPAGYTVPGTRSGDTVVAARDNVVNVVYSKALYSITVKYYQDSISGANQIGSVSLPAAALGTAINNVDLTLFAPSGYNTPGTRSGDTVVAARENIVNVLYTKSLHSITVYYYKDSVASSNQLGTASLPAAPVGTLITGVNASLYAPAYYNAPGTLSGDTVVKAGGSVVNVVYTKTQYQIIVQYYKDDLTAANLLDAKVYTGGYGDLIANIVDLTYAAPSGYIKPGTLSGDTVVSNRVNYASVLYTTNKYPITVNYYKDSVGTSNFLGTVSLPDATAGTAVNNLNLSSFAPAGYKTPGTASGDLVVQARPNVINVVYTKAVYTISVQYYKDSSAITNLLGTYTYEGALGAKISDIIDRTRYAPSGYITPGTMLGNEYVTEGVNVVQVVYSKSGYPIIVQYYKDNMTAANYINSVTVTGAPGMLVAGIVDASLYVPSDYVVPGTLFGDTVVAERNNYAYVVYVKATHPITVNYYKDSIAPANIVGTSSLPAAVAGTAINNVSLTQFAPTGYVTPGTLSGDTVVKIGGSVVNVLYSAAKYSVAVQYYKDSIVASNLLGSDALMSVPNIYIETIINRSLYAPAGYTTPGTMFGDVIVGERNNFVYVLYTKATYSITVNYYKDSVAASNLITALPLPSAVVGTPIDNVNLTLYVPSGYASPGTRSGDTVVSARDNVVNVVYNKYSQVYVYYFQDSVAGKFLGAESLQLNIPTGLPIYGVDLTKYAPEGYIPTGTMQGDLITKEPFALVSVVYTKAPPIYTVTIVHVTQAMYGNMDSFYEYKRDTFQAAEGTEIYAIERALSLPDYSFFDSSPVKLTVSNAGNTMTIRYTLDRIIY